MSETYISSTLDDLIYDNVVKKFFSKINFNCPKGCWLWTGTKSRTDYGIIHFKKNIQAHRFSWTYHNGPIPEGLCVCHKCDIPSCVNPDHLFLGTQLDNINDMISKGRNLVPARRKLLSNDEVEEIRKIYQSERSGVTRTRNEFSQKSLGLKFGVSSTEINKIVNNPSYFPRGS